MQSLPEKVQNFVDKVAGEKQGSNDDLSIQVKAQSASQAEFDRKLLEMKSQQELRKEWLVFLLKAGKDAVIFMLALIIVLRIDFYAFAILQRDTPSENEVRFAIAVLTATVSSLLSYLVGRASK